MRSQPDTLNLAPPDSGEGSKARAQCHARWGGLGPVACIGQNHFGPRDGEVSGNAIGAVVGRGDHDPLARQDTESVEIGACGPRRHHPGPVVVREGHGPFQRAGCQHRCTGAHRPEPLARQMWVGGGKVIGHSLDQPRNAAVVKPERRSARHDPGTGPFDRRTHRGAFIFQGGMVQIVAAKLEILLDKDNVAPRFSRCQGRRSDRPRPDPTTRTSQKAWPWS